MFITKLVEENRGIRDTKSFFVAQPIFLSIITIEEVL